MFTKQIIKIKNRYYITVIYILMKLYTIVEKRNKKIVISCVENYVNYYL